VGAPKGGRQAGGGDSRDNVDENRSARVKPRPVCGSTVQSSKCAQQSPHCPPAPPSHAVLQPPPHSPRAPYGPDVRAHGWVRTLTCVGTAGAVPSAPHAARQGTPPQPFLGTASTQAHRRAPERQSRDGPAFLLIVHRSAWAPLKSGATLHHYAWRSVKNICSTNIHDSCAQHAGQLAKRYVPGGKPTSNASRCLQLERAEAGHRQRSGRSGQASQQPQPKWSPPPPTGRRAAATRRASSATRMAATPNCDFWHFSSSRSEGFSKERLYNEDSIVNRHIARSHTHNGEIRLLSEFWPTRTGTGLVPNVI